MPDDDVRRFARVEVTLEQVRTLLAPLCRGDPLGPLEVVEGGLTNTVYRIPRATRGDALLLRIFAEHAAWEKERTVLRHLEKLLPVPEVLLADDGKGSLPYPSLVFRWIEGVTFNAYRRLATTTETLQLAEPLGALLAQVSVTPAGPDLRLEVDTRAQASSLEVLLSRTEDGLRRGPPRRRLGTALADALWRAISTGATAFGALGSPGALVHGDLGGRNVLVAPNAAGTWHIAGLIDWEAAFAGWPLWDVGSFFRYRRRFDEKFRASFERGYRAAGGRLPKAWWRTSRLLDATRQVATLAEERERPVVFAECRELLEELVQHDG